MENKIKEALNDPEALEQLYRQDKHGFKSAFQKVTSEVLPSDLIHFWQVRLQDTIEQKVNFTPLIISLIAVIFLARIPQIFGFSDSMKELFEIKNLLLIAFAGITFYELLRKENSKLFFWLGFLVFYSLMTLHLNSLSGYPEGQTFILALLHAPILFWFMFGLAFNIGKSNDSRAWTGFLRYNGDLLLFTGLVMICWTILLGITISLFESMDIKFSDMMVLDLYINAAIISPLIASFAIERIPTLTNKIVPLIARIFNPVLLIVLIIYLITIAQAGKNIYAEREFLIVFNIILFTVLSVTIFSLSNITGTKKDKFQFIVLYFLTLFACVLNLIALSAILYRLFTYGITPNKLAVTGMNLIIFANLITIGINLFQIQISKRDPLSISRNITRFLPLYGVWTFIVVIVFPIIF